MKTKLLSFVLTGTVCLSLFAGCQSSKLGSYSADAAKASPSPSAEETTASTKDFTPCYESYKPDEVMLTVNGIDVTWDYLFYWYANMVSSLESYYGDISDWDAVCSASEDGKSYRDFVTETVLKTIEYYCAIDSKAKDMGVELTEEDKASIQTQWQSSVDSYGNGDEAAFSEYLKKVYLTKDMFIHLGELTALHTRLFESMFGANGEKISKDEAVQKAKDMGYVRAKHILLSTMDDSGVALPDEQKAEKKATADKLLAELKGITDKTKLEARFDVLIKEYGEDPGMETFVDGYTYISGNQTMDPSFDTAVAELGEYKVSEIVETSFGYHIILRLPLKTTAVVYPTQSLEDGTAASLAYAAAKAMFGTESDNWAEESKVESSKLYDKMNIADVFSKATIVPETSTSVG